MKFRGGGMKYFCTKISGRVALLITTSNSLSKSVLYRTRECGAGLDALRLDHINILANIKRPAGGGRGQQEGGEGSQRVTDEHRIAAVTQGSPWVTNEHRIATVTHREEQYAHGLVHYL
jgi:hypothetical protein